MLGGNPRETTVKERDQSSAPTIFPHQTGWGPEDTTTIGTLVARHPSDQSGQPHSLRSPGRASRTGGRF